MVNWQRGVMRLMRITNHEVAVTQVEDFTDRYRRIHFTGSDLLGELSDVFPTLWVRLWFPHPEKGVGHLSQRGYTFVDIDLRAGSFSLDFVLHGDDDPGTDRGRAAVRGSDPDLAEATASPDADVATPVRPAGSAGGPASRWAARAQPGTTIEAALTPARIDLPGDTEHLVLLGDLTALPAVNSWLDWIPAEVKATVIVEDDHDSDGLPQTDDPNATWEWVRTSGAPGTALTERLRALDLDANGLYVWAAGERGLVKGVRSVLKDRGLEKKRHFSQFYWFADKPTG